MLLQTSTPANDVAEPLALIGIILFFGMFWIYGKKALKVCVTIICVLVATALALYFWRYLLIGLAIAWFLWAIEEAVASGVRKGLQ